MSKEIYHDSIPKLKISPSQFKGYGVITINRKEFGGNLIGKYVEVDVIVREYDKDTVNVE